MQFGQLKRREFITLFAPKRTLTLPAAVHEDRAQR
jgi:hypothetical protein